MSHRSIIGLPLVSVVFALAVLLSASGLRLTGPQSALAEQGSSTIYLPLIQSQMSRLSDRPFGVTAHLMYTPFYSDASRQQAIQMISGAGINSVRIDFSWDWLEYEKGSYQWAVIDPVIQQVSENKLDILAIIQGCPKWANSDRDVWFPPNDPNDYANFVGNMVERYDGDGVNDALDSPRIPYWQLWNEPNHPRFWSPGPTAGEYVRLLQPAYTAAKQADSSAIILMAGIAGDDPDFLTDMYVHGAKGYFDAVAIHPYTFPGHELSALIDKIDGTIAVMTAHNDVSPIWITEIGWSTATEAWGYRTVTDAEVAQWLAQVYSPEVLGRVEKVYWYTFRDTGIDPNDAEHHFGLVDFDLLPKPQYLQYQALQK